MQDFDKNLNGGCIWAASIHFIKSHIESFVLLEYYLAKI